MLQLTKPSNSIIFTFFTIFWGVIFVINYYLLGKNPLFICNDSYQYLSIAYDIYLDKKATGLINYALDLYYDEIALFGYDFQNLKPYHFPSYSAFLSLFYFIYENHNFVVFASQYLAFLIFSISSFLILKQYCKSTTSLAITLITIFSSPIILYFGDSGKEIICSGLCLMVIYLTLYSPNFGKIFNLIISSLILTFLCITRNFYLLLSLLIILYHLTPFKYRDDNPQPLKSLDKKTSMSLVFFIFIIPLCAYIYCYYFIEIHLFIFDNRTSIYGGKDLEDLIIRIITNLFLGSLMFATQYFGIFIEKESKTIMMTYNLITIFGFTLIGLIIYFKNYWGLSRANQHFKISRILIINIFNLAILISVIVKFNLMGYRLTMSYMPLLFLFIYQNFYKKSSNFTKSIIAIFLIVNLVANIKTATHFKQVSDRYHIFDKKIISIIEKYQVKNIAISTLRDKNFDLPMIYKYPLNINIYSSWKKYLLCDNLKNYHFHNIDFDVIISNHPEHDKCNFIQQNFIKINDAKLGHYFANKKLFKNIGDSYAIVNH